jgi:hypothetical protein
MGKTVAPLFAYCNYFSKRFFWLSLYSSWALSPLTLTLSHQGRGDFMPPSLRWEGLGEGARVINWSEVDNQKVFLARADYGKDKQP